MSFRAFMNCCIVKSFKITYAAGPPQNRNMDAGLARLMYNICSAASGFGIGVSGFLQFQLGCKKLQSRQKCNKGKELGVHIHMGPSTPLHPLTNSITLCVCVWIFSECIYVRACAFIWASSLGQKCKFFSQRHLKIGWQKFLHFAISKPGNFVWGKCIRDRWPAWRPPIFLPDGLAWITKGGIPCIWLSDSNSQLKALNAAP